MHLPARPAAIVSLSPTATEMLYAIGAGSQVKAVDSLSDYPANAPVTKLSAYQPNAEAIAAYKPDLVVISNDIGGITAKLKALSIPVLDLPAAPNLAGVYAEFTQLGAGDRARRAGAQGRQHAAAGDQQDRRGRAAARQAAHVLLRDRDQPLLLGNVIDLHRQPAVAARHEEHRRRGQGRGSRRRLSDPVGRVHPQGQPGLHHPGRHRADRRRPGRRDGFSGRPGWSVLTAVKDKHIIMLNADIASRWGPRVVQLLQTVAAGTKPGHIDRDQRARSGRSPPTAAASPPSPAAGAGPTAVRAATVAQLSQPPHQIRWPRRRAELPAGRHRSGRADRAGQRRAAGRGARRHRGRPGRAVAPAGPGRDRGQAAVASAPRGPALDTAIVWQIRLPRVVLGVLVGSMLAGGGAAYQGIFRNPLADPYLLGVAAGAGLGATIVVVSGGSLALEPPAAFAGAAVAVAADLPARRGGGRAASRQRRAAAPARSCWRASRSRRC